MRYRNGITRIYPVSRRKSYRVRALFPINIRAAKISAAYIITQIRPAQPRQTDIELLNFIALKIVIYSAAYRCRIAYSPDISSIQIVCLRAINLKQPRACQITVKNIRSAHYPQGHERTIVNILIRPRQTRIVPVDHSNINI